MTRQKIWDIILIVFSVYWTVFFLLDYWDKHPNYVLAIKYFRYTNLCLVVLAGGLALSYIVSKFNSGLISKCFNGIGIYLIAISLVTAFTISHNKYANLNLSSANFIHLYGRLSANFFSGYFLLLACFSAGNLILNRYYINVLKYKSFTIDFGLGAIFITLMLFLLGTIGQLKMIIVLPLLLILIGINWRGSLEFVIKTFVRPFKIKKENGFWGYFCLYLLFTFLVINLFAIDLPFPVGFDSRNLYINIANQISVTNKLVPGYQPYSWSLFISQGFLVFNKIETALFLSFITGVLCLNSVYHLSIRFLKINHTYSCLIVLFIGLIPTYANQFFIELKTDFALLFYQLLALNCVLEFFLKDKFSNNQVIFGLKKNKFKLLTLLGLFIGFGLAIKLLNLFLICSLAIVLWRVKGKFVGAAGLLLVMFAFILILGIHNISGLGKYHLGNEVAIWIYFFLGITLLLYSYIQDKNHVVTFSRQLIIIGAFSIIPLLPWIGKNYSETKSLSPTKLLLGDQAGPSEVLFTIEKNLNN